MSVYAYETYGELQPWIGREWLLTNGTGTYASSTLVGCNTRRYHGLLVPAMLPPVGRVVALSRVNESFHREGQSLELGICQFRDVFIPRGERFLWHFEKDVVVKFDYEAEGINLCKEVLLCWEKNVVGIRYTIDPGPEGPIEFRIQPFVALRDFHSLLKADASFQVQSTDHGCSVRRYGNSLYLICDQAFFRPGGDWWYNFTYSIETERGQEDQEDLFTPGYFSVQVDGSRTLVLWAGLEPVENLNWDNEYHRREKNLPGQDAPTIAQKRLVRAANDFVVNRVVDQENSGATILAGFPWFGDWGRDSMIALTGLLLTTRRYHQAGQVLCWLARHVHQGLIPNVFDDYTHQPIYNAADASLWFIHACHEYLRYSRDQETYDSVLRPACEEILQSYQNGTLFGIKMDESDGLIVQGDPTSQLTWMDAKTNGVVFTPRHGKAVEINALWYHALSLMGQNALVEKVAESFRRTFWINHHRGLADVVNETGRDDACRPNQIFAVSLAHSPLTSEQQHSVVEVVRKELLTPYGLRSLAPGHPKYQPRYVGSQFDRDKAYHNGTIWPWLIGAFLEAYLKVNQRSRASLDQARRWLEPLIQSLDEGCVGSISEIYEAQPPHRPVGAFAQAWSVAEVLRLAVELEF